MADLISKTGRIFDIHRLSTHDGPGLRTTVFLKGCSLKCAWCHNPESIHSYDQLQFQPNKCIGCDKCIQVCEQKALSKSEVGISINRDLCNSCMDCSSVCPSGAMNRIGENKNVESIFEEVLQDKLFYVHSGGGITISGGEPLIQKDFSYELLSMARENDIHTALDTSLQCDWSAIETVLPLVDLWLVDLKETDPGRQIDSIGVTDELIRENLEKLIQKIDRENISTKIWIRTPIIPGATAREDNIAGIANIINQYKHSVIERWELCSFNNMCGDKYKKLDLHWKFMDTPLISVSDKKQYLDWAKAYNQTSADVRISGLSLKE